MIKNLPIFISILFASTTLLTLILFYLSLRKSSLQKAHKNANLILIALIIWIIIQSFLTLGNFYNSDTNTIPPRIFLTGVLPTLLTIIFIFLSKKGRIFMDSLPLKNLTYLNIIRIPVEIGLYYLFIYKTIPELMTFQGRNFDILAGISAPFIVYFAFKENVIKRKLLLIWNIISFGLLLNIVVNAFLSAPSPLQLFAFDQPNIAILNFPVSFLPTVIVPIVLFGHLISIRRLILKKS